MSGQPPVRCASTFCRAGADGNDRPEEARCPVCSTDSDAVGELVPPDVSWPDFVRYVGLLAEATGWW